MKKVKNILSLLYKLLIVIVTGVGLYLNFKIADPQKMILYFTIISNLMVFIYFGTVLVLDLFGKSRKGDIYYIFGGLVTLFITLTMCVYQIALSDTTIYQNHVLECNFVHIYTPILTILYYLIFTEKGNIKKWYSVLWVIPLIIYAIFIEIYSTLGGKFLDGQSFPYPFLDANLHGYYYVMTICGLFIVAFIGFGLIVYHIDNYFEKRSKKHE